MTTLTQGAGLKEGRAARDAGMEQAEAGDQYGTDTKVIDQAIEHLANQGVEFSANDLRELLPEVRQPLIGARMRSAARSAKGRPSLIVHVSYTPSTLQSTHAHDIKTWRGRVDVDNLAAHSPP